MPSTNSTLRRVEAGAIITVSDGTTTNTLTCLEPGTWKFKAGFYKALEWTDRGVLQVPYEGDEQPGELELSVKYTGSANAADLKKFLQTRDTATGKMKMYTWTIKNPDYKGAATGELITLSNCFLGDGAPEIKAGNEFDMISVKMKHNVALETATTY
jgi:hypothetical protein